MRAIGLDVHRGFCEVAIVEEGGEQAYKRTVADWQAVAKQRAGADATPGRASQPI